MKLVDMNDSKSFGLYHVGSSPTSGTIEIIADTAVLVYWLFFINMYISALCFIQ